jgi:hypothetical protein
MLLSQGFEDSFRVTNMSARKREEEVASLTRLNVEVNSSSVMVIPLGADICGVGVDKVCKMRTVSGMREDRI